MCITTFLRRMYDKIIFMFYDCIDNDTYYKKDEFPNCDYLPQYRYRF